VFADSSAIASPANTVDMFAQLPILEEKHASEVC
jgi:hypothetical protein